MARLKSSYRPRKFADGGVVAAEPPAPKSEADDASLAFAQQIAELRRAEDIQRQRAAQAVQTPPTLPESREERLQLWRSQGIGQDDAEHLNDLIEFPAITAEAVADAKRQGLDDPKSVEYHQAVKVAFQNRILHRLNASPPANPVSEALEQARQSATARQAPPDFEAREMETPSRTIMYSAPVERTVPGSNPYGDRPGRITLTPAMKEAAKIAGVSEREYAEQLLRLREAKANGDYGGSP